MIAMVMGSLPRRGTLGAGLATLTLACGACAFSTSLTAFSPVLGELGNGYVCNVSFCRVRSHHVTPNLEMGTGFKRTRLRDTRP